MKDLYTEYLNGTLEAELNAMGTKEIMKSYKYHGFGIRPSSNRETVIEQFIKGMTKAINKGNAFMKEW